MILLIGKYGWMLIGLLLLLDFYWFDYDLHIRDGIHIMLCNNETYELGELRGFVSWWIGMVWCIGKIGSTMSTTRISGKHNWSAVKTTFLWETTWWPRDGYCGLKEQWKWMDMSWVVIHITRHLRPKHGMRRVRLCVLECGLTRIEVGMREYSCIIMEPLFIISHDWNLWLYDSYFSLINLLW